MATQSLDSDGVQLTGGADGVDDGSAFAVADQVRMRAGGTETGIVGCRDGPPSVQERLDGGRVQRKGRVGGQRREA